MFLGEGGTHHQYPLPAARMPEGETRTPLGFKAPLLCHLGLPASGQAHGGPTHAHAWVQGQWVPVWKEGGSLDIVNLV